MNSGMLSSFRRKRAGASQTDASGVLPRFGGRSYPSLASGWRHATAPRRPPRRAVAPRAWRGSRTRGGSPCVPTRTARSAISRSVRPRARSANTSASRAVSPERELAVDRRGPAGMPFAPRARSRRLARIANGSAPSAMRLSSAARRDGSSATSAVAHAASYGQPRFAQSSAAPRCSPTREAANGGAAPVASTGPRPSRSSQNASSPTAHCRRRRRASSRTRATSSRDAPEFVRWPALQPGRFRTSGDRRPGPLQVIGPLRRGPGLVQAGSGVGQAAARTDPAAHHERHHRRDRRDLAFTQRLRDEVVRIGPLSLLEPNPGEPRQDVVPAEVEIVGNRIGQSRLEGLDSFRVPSNLTERGARIRIAAFHAASLAQLLGDHARESQVVQTREVLEADDAGRTQRVVGDGKGSALIRCRGDVDRQLGPAHGIVAATREHREVGADGVRLGNARVLPSLAGVPERGGRRVDQRIPIGRAAGGPQCPRKVRTRASRPRRRRRPPRDAGRPIPRPRRRAPADPRRSRPPHSGPASRLRLRDATDPGARPPPRNVRLPVDMRWLAWRRPPRRATTGAARRHRPAAAAW